MQGESLKLIIFAGGKGGYRLWEGNKEETELTDVVCLALGEWNIIILKVLNCGYHVEPLMQRSAAPFS